MEKSKISNGVGFILAFLLGMLVASYYPLPGTNVLECPEYVVCPAGFATLEEMSSLVGELQNCREVKK